MTTLDLAALIAQAEENGADFKKVHIPAGDYRCKVTHARYSPSKAGNPGFSVRTVVLDGPYKDKGFWSNFYLTPIKKDGTANHAGVAIFFRLLDALGVATDGFKNGTVTVEQVATDGRLIGVETVVTTEDHTYNQETSTRAKSFKKVQGQAPPTTYISPQPPRQASGTYQVPPPPLPTGQAF